MENNVKYWGIWNKNEAFEFSKWFTDVDGILAVFASATVAEVQKQIVADQWGINPDNLEVKEIK